ncbi:hypothetical protein PPTG_04606 [Phytophthora nicotianae INRA-310]|uniref:Uncharacterized protein n=1 Tax=Phytophthora nicotianae (strain INRA-310) TaxID=761204 RepID=W2R1L0_PHYN3|nr:hypothetical protein PPTG_04606 [Phytophthora nicotianae INRA-310]ETN19238.1 hypothetical protein PPTG_04606 [Phytophthora nicotianae INRA-310]
MDVIKTSGKVPCHGPADPLSRNYVHTNEAVQQTPLQEEQQQFAASNPAKAIKNTTAIAQYDSWPPTRASTLNGIKADWVFDAKTQTFKHLDIMCSGNEG